MTLSSPLDCILIIYIRYKCSLAQFGEDISVELWVVLVVADQRVDDALRPLRDRVHPQHFVVQKLAHILAAVDDVSHVHAEQTQELPEQFVDAQLVHEDGIGGFG